MIAVNSMRATARDHQSRYRQIGDLRRFSCIIPRTLPWIMALLLSNPMTAQDAKQKPGRASRQVTKIVESTNVHRQVRYNPGDRPDPFLNPLLIIKKEAKLKEDEEESRGLPPPGIAGTYISQAVLLGTVIRDEGRVAVIRGTDPHPYFLKEGDRFFDGYLKSIESDFVKLVRETKMKSGKILTQEVTLRLKKP